MDFETPSIFLKPPEPDEVADSSSIIEVPTSVSHLPPTDLERIRTWNEVSFHKRFKSLNPPNKVTYYYGLRLGSGNFLSVSTQTRSQGRAACAAPFDMVFLNELDSTFLHFKKTSGCKCRFFPCAHQKIQVFDPLENFVGTVSPKWFCCCSRVKLVGKDAVGNVRFEVKSVDCCGTSKFQIVSSKKSTPMGNIQDFPGSCAEGDVAGGDCPPNFGVNFDSGVNVQDKALMIGAALLVDYMYFKALKPSKDGECKRQRMGSFSSRRIEL